MPLNRKQSTSLSKATILGVILGLGRSEYFTVSEVMKRAGETRRRVNQTLDEFADLIPERSVESVDFPKWNVRYYGVKLRKETTVALFVLINLGRLPAKQRPKNVIEILARHAKEIHLPSHRDQYRAIIRDIRTCRACEDISLRAKQLWHHGHDDRSR